MNIEIKEHGRYSYDLIVNGVVEIKDETFTIVDNVRDALLGRPQPSGECREIAEAIRKRHLLVIEGVVQTNPHGNWSDVDKGLYIGGECVAYECQHTIFDNFEGKRVRVTVERLPDEPDEPDNT